MRQWAADQWEDLLDRKSRARTFTIDRAIGIRPAKPVRVSENCRILRSTICGKSILRGGFRREEVLCSKVARPIGVSHGDSGHQS